MGRNVCSVPLTHTLLSHGFNYASFVAGFESENVSVSTLIIYIQRVATCGPLRFHMALNQMFMSSNSYADSIILTLWKSEGNF